jgi:hypothetical protein
MSFSIDRRCISRAWLCVLLAGGLEIPLTLRAQTYTTIGIPSSTLDGTIGVCSIDQRPVVAPTTGKAKDTLIVRLVRPDDSKQEVTAPDAILVRLDSQIEYAIGQGQSTMTLSLAPGAFDGKHLVASRLTGDRPLCTRFIPVPVKPQPPEQRIAIDNQLSLRTGVEFVSSDEFNKKQSIIPVAASWNVGLGKIPSDKLTLGLGSKLKNHTFIASALAERTELPKVESFFSCRPSVVRIGTKANPPVIPQNPIMPAPCSAPTMQNDTTLVFYGDVRDSTQSNGAGVAWRFIGSLRLERMRTSAPDILVGPLVFAGFETNPVRRPNRTLVNIYGFGYSIRQVDDKGADRFALIASYSRTFNYAQHIIVRDSSGKALTTPDVDVTRATLGWNTRLLMRAAPGFYIRGMTQFNKGGPSLASVAILTDLDFGGFIKSLGLGGKSNDKNEAR